jgi:hypothetical protein
VEAGLMFFKNLEDADKRILGICLMLLLFSIVMIFNDRWVYELTSINDEELEQIGTVTKLDNDVRRRHQIAFTWLPIQKKNDVFQGDSIFTGNSSGVLIKTKTGEEISIAANSLVVIKTRQDSVSIDIGFGSVEGKMQKGKTLRITSNNSLTELDGSDATIKVDAGDGNKLVLNVLSGEVRVKTGGGTRILKRNDSTEINNSDYLISPEKNTIQILMPLANQRFKFMQERSTEFRWKSSRKFNRMKIKVATDIAMKNTLVDAGVEQNAYTAFNLPVDTPLFWQVISDAAVSEVASFYLVGDAPPQPVSPLMGLNIFYDAAIIEAKAGASVKLEWAGGSPALRYEVQLAANQIFENPRVYKTKTTNYTTESLPRGQYYWRVRSLDFETAKWSEIANFKVGPEPTRFLSLPVMQMTSNEYFIKTRIHGKKPEPVHKARNRKALEYVENFPTLQWSRVSGAKQYSLQIATGLDFKTILLDKKLKDNFFTWRTTNIGTYFWRVRAISDLYKEGTYSQPKVINIDLAAPAALTQAAIIDEVPDQALLLAPPPPIELKWNATILTDSYQVQFSKSSDFKAPLDFFTTQDSRKVQIPAQGSYYWRIRSLNEKKQPVSPWGTYSVAFERVYKDPALSNNLIALYPKQQDSLVVVGKGNSEILFQWNNPYEDAAYRIEISYDADFKEITHTAKVKTNSYALKERLISNTVYWRVRAEKDKDVSPWTGANRFYVSYEGTPFDYETSELLFASRLKARERQQTLLAETRRALIALRTPASKMDWQLETPQATFDYTTMVLEPNWPENISQKVLNKQNLDQFYAQVKNYPTFTWQKVPAAERYFIEIAKDEEFKNILIKAPAFNTYYQWETVRPGQYFWRVQAFNDRYTRSDYSPVKPFQVTVNSPASINIDTFVEVLEEPREMWQPPAPSKLQWKPVIFARAYDVEISDDINFRTSKTFRTDTTDHEIKVDYSGLYYWRVKALNDYGVAISSWSPTRSVEFIQTTRTPASVNQLTGLFPKDRTLVYVGQGDIKVPFHYVTPEAGTFLVEVSKTSDFKNIISKAESRSDQVRIHATWPEGKLYWRVRKKDVDSLRGLSSEASFGEGFSKVYEFFLKKEPVPYQGTSKFK